MLQNQSYYESHILNIVCCIFLLYLYMSTNCIYVYLHLRSMIPCISDENLRFIHSSIEAARLKSTRPFYRLVEIYVATETDRKLTGLNSK